MSFLNRLKSAARILFQGETRAAQREAIHSITADEVAEIKRFFPREKFFIMGHYASMDGSKKVLPTNARTMAVPNAARVGQIFRKGWGVNAEILPKRLAKRTAICV